MYPDLTNAVVGNDESNGNDVRNEFRSLEFSFIPDVPIFTARININIKKGLDLKSRRRLNRIFKMPEKK